MEYVLVFAVCVIAWFLNSVSSSSLENNKEIAQKSKKTASIKNTTFSSTSKSTLPTFLSKKIRGNRNLVVNSTEGEFRFFETYYINSVACTFGFPKPNCIDKRIWFGIGTREIERIPYEEAMKRINATSLMEYIHLKEQEQVMVENLAFNY